MWFCVCSRPGPGPQVRACNATCTHADHTPPPPAADGSGSGGEGVRLKLQTPLFVADALVGAAGRQLATELAAARAELEGVALVARQLARFRWGAGQGVTPSE